MTTTAVERATCNANTKRGGSCGRPAGWGTDHVGIGTCKLHGGSTPSANKHAARIRAEALAIQYGGPIPLEPHEALLQELARTAGHVAWLGNVVRNLEEDELVGPVGSEGPTNEFGGEAHPKAERSIWITLYQDERKHMTDVAKACIAAGIEERRVRLAEQQGQVIATVIKGIVKDLGVADHPQLGAIVRKHLTEAVETTGRELEPAAA